MVSGYFGDDGGGCDAKAFLVSANNVCVHVLKMFERIAVDEHSHVWFCGRYLFKKSGGVR